LSNKYSLNLRLKALKPDQASAKVRIYFKEENVFVFLCTPAEEFQISILAFTWIHLTIYLLFQGVV
jgi:hypothetical protein